MNSLTKILIAAIVIALLVGANHIIAQTWTSLNGPQITKNVKDISLSGDVVYIAENDYVQKSTNGGAGWFVTATPYSAPSFVLVKPNEATKVITTKSCELMYHPQGGDFSTQWQLKIDDPNLIPLRLVAAVNDNNVMLLGRRYNVTGTISIWRSQLGGSDWNRVEGFTAQTDINDFSAYPDATSGHEPGIIWAAGSSNASPPPSSNKTAPAEFRGLWYSTNYGQTWPNNKLGGYNVKSVALVPRTATTMYHVYAAANSGGSDALWKLTDHTNNNWTQIFSGPTEILMVRYNPNNNAIFLATNDGVWRSTDAATTDGGGTWAKMTGLTDLNVQSVAISGSNTVFAGTANSLYKSTNNGDSWTEVGKMNLNPHIFSR